MQLSLVRDYIIEWIKKRVARGTRRELRVPWRKDKIISIIGLEEPVKLTISIS